MSSLSVTQRGLFARTVVLDEFGVRRGKHVIAWEAVDHYRYDWQDWRRPGDILVVDPRRRVIRIAPLFSQWHEAAEAALGKLHAHLRDLPFFDPFDIEGDDLIHPGSGRLPLAEIEHVELASVGASVHAVVHRRGAGEWVETDASDIADLWLLLEELGRRGVTVLSSLELYLPAGLSQLAEQIAAGNTLPRARALRPD